MSTHLSGFDMPVPNVTNVAILSVFPPDLEQDGFCKNPFFHSIIAEVPEHLKSEEGEKKPPLHSC